jgi:hypothetical protein
MSQPASPTDGLPTLGTIPLGPDEPELFADAMARIIRHLGDRKTPPRSEPVLLPAHPSLSRGVERDYRVVER